MPRALTVKSRDPNATRARILAAAKAEFARKGLGGARVDDIAARAKANKRMLYHYFGNKEDLFRITLEDAYAEIREAEAKLEIEKDDPITALKRLIRFTWDYYLENPEFITLVNSENLHKARHIKSSERMREMSRPFVGRMRNLLERGAKATDCSARTSIPCRSTSPLLPSATTTSPTASPGRSSSSAT